MIEKLPGVPKINKLRVIHLYEADYNVFNKLIWQRGIVWEAHQRQTLNPSQAGSRPYHTSIEVVISKSLKYTYSNLTRIPMATMDNDAKSCYDRIVAALALLVSHKFGVPETFCKTVGTTLEQMQFCIRTAMGDSAASYSHSDSTPIHGVGQGGTASPAFWLIVSSLLIDCYQKRATGMTMSDPAGAITVHQYLEALVDDTSLFTNLPNEPDVSLLVQALEKDAQHWDSYLSSSGGCLELTKCFYYVLAWTFRPNGDACPMTVSEIQHQATPIRLQEHNKDHLTTIAIKEPSTAHRTLGVWKTMTGNVDEQVTILRQRSNNMTNIVATSGMYPYQADVALRMIYTPSMSYCLPAVSIPAKTLDKIQYKALETFIPAMGYNRGFPRVIMFAHEDYGGEGIPHLYTESRLRQLEILIMHLRADTTLGKLFRIILNWTQLHIGIHTPLFEYQHDITYVSNWFTSLHKFILEINGKLCIKNTSTPQYERQGDICIMDAFLQCKLSKTQLRTLYNWRLFFRVQLLSDLTTAAGDKIHESYLTFPTSSSDLRSDRVTKLQWPIQQAPTSKASFQLWTRTLRLCFIRTGTQLNTPLGKWIVNPSQSQSTWRAHFNTEHNELILRTPTSLLQFSSITSTTPRTHTFDMWNSTELHRVPDTHVPVDISHNEDSIIAYHHKMQSEGASLMNILPDINDIQDAINHSPQWKRHLLQHFRIHNVELFHQAIIESDPPPRILVVSDGGLKDGKGSFGVAIGTFNQELCSLEGPAPGNSELLTSFRSEAYGLLAAVSFLHLFVTSHRLQLTCPRQLNLYCDNMAVVSWTSKLLSNISYPSMFIKSDVDVIMQIRHELQELSKHRITFDIQYVAGHQDKHLQYNDLSRPAQLNVDADQSATNFLRHGPERAYTELPANPVTLYICDQLIHRDLKRHIRIAALSPGLREYMLKKFTWHTTTPDLIWWQVHGSSIRSFSRNDRRRIRKMIFNWLPTSLRLKKYDKAISHLCPSCNTMPETHKHIYLCTHVQRTEVKDHGIAKLDEFMADEQYTPPIVRKLLIDHIEVLCLNLPTPTYSDLPANIALAYREQEQIGWCHLLKGRLSRQWGTVIADHLAATRIPEKQMSALIWGRKFIKLVYQLFLDIWHKRNEVGHACISRNESKLTRERILAQIEALQISQPVVRFCDREFVYRPFEEIQQYTLSNLISWYRVAMQIIKAQKRHQLNTHTLHDCLLRAAYDPDNPVNQTDTFSSQSSVSSQTSVSSHSSHSDSSLSSLQSLDSFCIDDIPPEVSFS